MGNVLIDLDQRFSKFQFSYIDAYRKGQFEIASSLLRQANSNLPLDARVNPMPRFVRRGQGLRAEQSIEIEAKEYCDKWSDYVWTSIAEYSTQMLENIQD